MSTGQQGRARRTTHRVRISLSKPHTRCRQFVDIGRNQILGAVTIGIDCSLIISEENHHIRGFSLQSVNT